MAQEVEEPVREVERDLVSQRPPGLAGAAAGGLQRDDEIAERPRGPGGRRRRRGEAQDVGRRVDPPVQPVEPLDRGVAAEPDRELARAERQRPREAPQIAPRGAGDGTVAGRGAKLEVEGLGHGERV